MLQYGQDCVAAYVSAEVSLCSDLVETALEQLAKAALVTRSPALLAELGARTTLTCCASCVSVTAARGGRCTRSACVVPVGRSNPVSRFRQRPGPSVAARGPKTGRHPPHHPDTPAAQAGNDAP
jgi:hypothetical protein